MNTAQLYNLIDEFSGIQQKALRRVHEIFGMPLPINLSKWLEWSDYFYYNQEKKVSDKIKVFPHGFGVAIHTEEFSIDFDFSQNYKVCLFNPARLYNFQKSNNISTGFTTEKEITELIEFELKAGRIITPDYRNNYYVKD
jgi:hypothetical protein